MRKRVISFLLVLGMVFGTGFQASASRLEEIQQQKTEAERQKAETEKELNAVNQSIDAITDKQKEIKSQIKNLDGQLVDAILELEHINADIAYKEEEIAETEAEYEKYKKLEEEQYAAMKVRIQYLYEKGESDFFSMLLESDNLTDLLNKADFVQEVTDYDEKKRAEYETTKQQMESLKVTLEAEKDSLLETKEKQQSQKDRLDRQIADAKTKQSNFETELANAQHKVEEYQETIQEQNALIKRLEEEEQRAVEADDAKGGNSGSHTATGSGTGTDIANYGLQFVGYPYVWGGNSLTNGTDCSGFVNLVHAHFGIRTPRQSGAIAGGGKAVSHSDLQPGDVVCYPGHVGIYIGNGKIVHASSAKTGIKVNNYNYRTPTAYRRYW